jgi:hypothetical protein
MIFEWIGLTKSESSLAKGILWGAGITVGYIWLLSGTDLQKVCDEYRILREPKAIVSGQIISAEEFSEEVEKNDGRRIDIVHGYSYKYNFQTLNHQDIVAEGWNYADLPLKKSLNDIPYRIEVEYVIEKPELNRINGLWSNDPSLFEWFKRHVLLKLLGLVFCGYLSIRLIKGAVDEYRMGNK